MDQKEEKGSSGGAQAQPLQPGYLVLQTNIVLHEKSPISDGFRVFRGTFGNNVTGNKDIALKITKDGEMERKEAEMHLSLPEHPNFVQSIQMDVFEYRGIPSIYIAMELCEINLHDYVVTQKEKEVPFDPIKYLSFAKDIARGLSFLHGLKKIHRNLKPSNILLTENCTIAKISDFGLREAATSGGTTEATSLRSKAGKYGWKSPELLKFDTDISTYTDIFSCGIIFAFMWTYGKHPYGPKRKYRNQFILASKGPDLDGILLANPKVAEHLLGHMLSRTPDYRPTANQVLEHEILV